MNASVKAKSLFNSSSIKDATNRLFGDTKNVSVVESNIHFMYPKYIRLMEAVRKYKKMFELLIATGWKYDPESLENAKAHLLQIDEMFSKYFYLKYETHASFTTEFEFSKYPMTAEQIATFAAVYTDSKKCSIITVIMGMIIAYNEISSLVNIEHIDKLIANKCYLIRSVKADLTSCYEAPTRLIKIINKFYEIAREVHNTISQPDTDPEKMKEILIEMIAPLRRVIPDCKDALDMIESNIDLINHNFGTYHRDFTASGDPSIIVQNIIGDISKNVPETSSVRVQFRKIIGFLKKSISKKHRADMPKKECNDEDQKNLDEMLNMVYRINSDADEVSSETPVD